MESVAARLNSPRFQRYLLWIGVAVFAIGAAVLVFTLVGGSDNNGTKPDKGFHAQLPAKAVPLRNADGATVKTYAQLDPQVRSDIKTFIATAVARRHLRGYWHVVAPSMKAGSSRAA